MPRIGVGPIGIRVGAGGSPDRSKQLNTVTTGPLAPRPFKRNPDAAKVLASMAQSSKDGFASSTRILAANAKIDAYSFNYHTGSPKQANLVKPPKDGVLELTVIMNVSGHDKADPGAKDRYAETNRYCIRVTYPDGSSQEMRGIDRLNKNGREYATAQDICIDVKKPGTYAIEGWPEGSAGVGGYVEGRRYLLHVGAANFYKPDFNTSEKRNGVSVRAYADD